MKNWYKILFILLVATISFSTMVNITMGGCGITAAADERLKGEPPQGLALSSDSPGIKLVGVILIEYLNWATDPLTGLSTDRPTDVTPTFEWIVGTSADNHRIEVATDYNFTSVVDMNSRATPILLSSANTKTAITSADPRS